MTKGLQGSATKVGEEPEEEREAEAQNETGDDGKIKRSVFVTIDDVAGKTAEAQREFSAEVEKSAKENEEAAEEEERAAEFAERVHGKDSRRNEAKKERS
jgi:hypothetical protein